jgi:hypothetical protein
MLDPFKDMRTTPQIEKVFHMQETESQEEHQSTRISRLFHSHLRLSFIIGLRCCDSLGN